MNKYLKILKLFVRNDDMYPAMSIPNICNNFASAANGAELVFFDKTLLPKGTVFDTNFDVGKKYPDIQRFLSIIPNINTVLDTEKIKNMIFDYKSNPVKPKYCYMRIGNAHFSVRFVEKLIKVSAVLGAEIRLVYEYPEKPSMFKIGDASIVVLPLIMPHGETYHVGSVT